MLTASSMSARGIKAVLVIACICNIRLNNKHNEHCASFLISTTACLLLHTPVHRCCGVEAIASSTSVKKRGAISS